MPHSNDGPPRTSNDRIRAGGVEGIRECQLEKNATVAAAVLVKGDYLVVGRKNGKTVGNPEIPTRVHHSCCLANRPNRAGQMVGLVSKLTIVFDVAAVRRTYCEVPGERTSILKSHSGKFP